MAVIDWINIHTHRPGRGLNIVDTCLGEVAVPEEEMVLYSLGIHPMHIDDTAEKQLREIERAVAEGKIVAVGESGLDRNAVTPMEVQLDLFERQAEIAGRYHLPLIIHGVRAVPEIIGVHNRCGSGGWIMHGFNNRREVLEELLRHGFYISAGRHVMNGESQVYRLLPEIPDDRLFIETDNSDFTIEEIYRVVAERRGMTMGALQQTVRNNFERLFR